jgi:two-component SAPR family response regulator
MKISHMCENMDISIISSSLDTTIYVLSKILNLNNSAHDANNLGPFHYYYFI